MGKRTAFVSVDDLNTWTKYRKGLCDSCVANCCTMPVEMGLSDLIRLGVVDSFEAETTSAKQLAKRLQKEGVIDHFNFKNEIYTLARKANRDCIYLHPQTRRCTIYEIRPEVCRKHPTKASPRPKHCPYQKK